MELSKEQSRIRALLEALCPLPGPSGFEAPVAQKAAELLAPFVDEVKRDRMGNVLGVRRCGRPGAKTILLDAHLDEIGLITLGMEQGYLRFRTIGGVDPRVLPNSVVTLLTDPPLTGVVACLPPHVLGPEEASKAVPVPELWIDTGLSAEQAAEKIPFGTPAVFACGCSPLGAEQMCGKAMDDRACFAALLYAAQLLQEQKLDVDVCFLGSTREEVNYGGAITAVYSAAPHCCIAVDVTHGRTPDGPKGRTFELGKGPAIGVGPNMTRWITEGLTQQAKALELPVQLEVMEGATGTNAWPMQVSREGVPTGLVSIPLKYMHSPMETVDLADLEAAARLLCAFVESLGEEAAQTCS